MQNSGDHDGPERVSFKRDRPAPYSKDARRFQPLSARSPPYFRVFVSNIPYEEKWQNLKDIFRKEGELQYSVNASKSNCAFIIIKIVLVVWFWMDLKVFHQV